MKSFATLAAVLLMCLIALAGCATPVHSLADGRVGWVAFASSKEPVTLRGLLNIPTEPVAAKRPAIIIVHSSGGHGPREAGWAQFLRSQGYATFELDYFTPRNVQAESPVQRSPTHDIFDAQKLLSSHPAIDPTRIAVIGFSRGGLMVLEALNRPMFETGAVPLGAHVAVYPNCQAPMLTRRLLPVPALILAGELGDATPADQCELFVQRMRDRDGVDIKLIVYPRAHHGWSGNFTGVWYHPASRRNQTIRADAAITQQSYRDTAEFLGKALGWPQDR